MGGRARVGASGSAHRFAAAVGESERLGEVDDLHERSAVDALRRRPRHRQQRRLRPAVLRRLGRAHAAARVEEGAAAVGGELGARGATRFDDVDAAAAGPRSMPPSRSKSGRSAAAAAAVADAAVSRKEAPPCMPRR